jgi:hypothetical protein
MKENNENRTDQEVDRRYPFQSPEGYFDALPERLMSNIEIERKSPKTLTFHRLLMPVLSVAASVAIILGLIYIPSMFSSSEKIAAGKSADIEYYLTYQLSALAIFETFGEPVVEKDLGYEQLEEVLIATVSEYELIDFNSVK